MSRIRRFVREHVEPADRLCEMVFGLVMALGVTGAIRLGATHLENRELFVSVAGCNLAWGIVDGVVLVLMRIFERGRIYRVMREARKASDDDRAYEIVERELSPDIVRLMTAEERGRLQALSLAILARANFQQPSMHRGDFLHGAAAGLLVMLPTIPVVIPYLIFDSAFTAIRVSSVVALVLLFLIGCRWGQMVGGHPLRIGGALVLLGIVLVGITLALGG